MYNLFLYLCIHLISLALTLHIPLHTSPMHVSLIQFVLFFVQLVSSHYEICLRPIFIIHIFFLNKFKRLDLLRFSLHIQEVWKIPSQHMYNIYNTFCTLYIHVHLSIVNGQHDNVQCNIQKAQVR